MNKKKAKLKEITEEYKKRGIENPERAAAMYLKGFITAKKFSFKEGPLLSDERIEQLYNQFMIPEQEDHYKNVPPIVGGE